LYKEEVDFTDFLYPLARNLKETNLRYSDKVLIASKCKASGVDK
jgi:hypothetical protein